MDEFSVRWGLSLGLVLSGCSNLTAPHDEKVTPLPPPPVASAAAAQKPPAEEEEKSAPLPPAPRIPAAHILLAYKGAPGAPAKVVRTKEQARKLAADLIRRSVKEDFTKLSKQYSDDATTAAKGGDLGEISVPAQPPLLVDAAKALASGGVTSSPVETPAGFHVLKRLAK